MNNQLSPDELCSEMNERIGHDLLDVVNNDFIRVKPEVNYKLIKKLGLEEFIQFWEGEPIMTLKLQGYADELCRDYVVVTKRGIIF